MKSVVAIYAKHLLFLSLAAGMLSALLFIILPSAWFSPALPFLFVFYYACSHFLPDPQPIFANKIRQVCICFHACHSSKTVSLYCCHDHLRPDQ